MSDLSVAPAALPSPKRPGFWLPVASLWWRDVVRFLRQPSRIVGLIAAPLLFWFLLGSGLGSSFRPPSASPQEGFLHYFFPGTLVMIVLFTSIFSNMSVIEDRREGFLQSVLATPISRSSLVLGRVLGGTTQAVVPGLLSLLLGPVVGFSLRPLPTALALGVLVLIALSLNSVGFLIAWRMDSVQGFHAVLNLVFIPLWVLSGAVFPASGASGWVRWIMAVNPLSYQVAALREALSASTFSPGSHTIALGTSASISLLFCLLSMGAAIAWAGRPTEKHLA